jgi:diguanylate cyclase (GGDEF)-like protein
MFDMLGRGTTPIVLGAGILVIALMTSGATFFLHREYEASFTVTAGNLRNLSLVLTEQTERAVQSLELVQTNLVDRIKDAGVTDSAGLKVFAGTPAMRDFLLKHIAPLPHIEALSIVDSQGTAVSTSRQFPAPVISVADRAYFLALRNDRRLSQYVSEPIRGRGQNGWTVVIAQPIWGEDEQFIGLIFGSVSLEYFEKLYSAIVPSADSSISLYRQDGVLLARHPSVNYDDGGITRERDGVVSAVLASGRGGIVRGADRIFTATALSRYPMVVVTSDTYAAALSGWWSLVVLVGAATVAVSVAVAIACLLSLKQSRAAARTLEMERLLARQDTVTGLSNRIHFKEKIAEAVAQAVPGDEGFGLLLIDLDEFKLVNDTFGHPAGDQLLQAVSDRLRTTARSTDVVCRLGGDEFAVIQMALQPVIGSGRLAARLQEVIALPYEINGKCIQVGASIGTAHFPLDASDPGKLLQAADFALYTAKRDGRNTVRAYDRDMETARQARRDLERDLRTALEQEQFQVFYQPFLDLQSNTISGFEALVRWDHPSRGILFPVDFISVAEEMGVIGALGTWVLQKACAEATSWPPNLRVSVNLSAAQFRTGNLLNSIKQALESSKLRPDQLELELTETVLIEDAGTKEMLLSIKNLGVSIALDDFGTGYASMMYLRRFPFNKIKIDRAFVQEIGISKDSTAIVNATLNLAHSLGLTTTAEGVETHEHLEMLRTAGCAEAQGYLIARPMPSSEVASYLAHSGRNGWCSSGGIEAV